MKGSKMAHMIVVASDRRKGFYSLELTDEEVKAFIEKGRRLQSKDEVDGDALTLPPTVAWRFDGRGVGSRARS